ncbi:enoyl-[acyl-carrier protein] reductase III [Serratia fonticola]|jgi:enoyl-[acyl-carrier protein] reductase III|uniref:Enoyl-[acyl-carrier protein] reductase III n=1 Tax=Serratia fonticola TaxID=47917 RepID=A0A542D323_SERFO|nr:SDR family oxidoreductase [Serratia fonticola]TQI80541.1 enoyl-[acyl-carrier protein] reductase III [Serratia fonticola]TQI97434.1 enoyl-[acyl-carrier protein] reductase III [Serratia fonticola]TVZ71931.1 enoyl-[acyl-carrier protein] reductase III [Serratia fonticola]
MSKGQTVLITGAGRGIGMAIAEKLAQEGYDLILNYRKDQGKSAANLQRFVAAENRVKVTLAKADISEPRDISEMVKKLKQEGIERIDHLVLNAAAAPFKPFMEMTRNDWKLLLNTNLIGNTACVQEVVPMMTQGGTICAISSLGSQRVLPKYPLGIAKSALENLVRYLEIELYDRKIRVNGVCAGVVNTDMAPFLKELWPEMFQRYEDAPRRWLVEPEEVANITAFLVSDQSSAIRGATLIADLGMTLEP